MCVASIAFSKQVVGPFRLLGHLLTTKLKSIAPQLAGVCSACGKSFLVFLDVEFLALSFASLVIGCRDPMERAVEAITMVVDSAKISFEVFCNWGLRPRCAPQSCFLPEDA